ncbi:MAG: 3-hydroxyacyl-CoA dehydrogenase NAD-binding domain-containing protein, partial [Anaerolineales bacterium]
MNKPIREAVVIGAGTMGAQIAAHLANAHVKTWLLDIVPDQLTEKEEKAGFTLEDKQVRNRIAREGLGRASKASPAAFFTESKKSWITIGNLEDYLE